MYEIHTPVVVYSGSHLPSSLPNRIKQTSSASALSSSSEPLAAELPELPTVHDADLRIFTAVLRASILSKQICASCSVACGSRWKVRPAVCSRARSNLNMQGSLRTLRARECPPHPSNHIHSNLYRADFVFRALFAAAAAQQVQGVNAVLPRGAQRAAAHRAHHCRRRAVARSCNATCWCS